MITRKACLFFETRVPFARTRKTCTRFTQQVALTWRLRAAEQREGYNCLHRRRNEHVPSIKGTMDVCRQRQQRISAPLEGQRNQRPQVLRHLIHRHICELAPCILGATMICLRCHNYLLAAPEEKQTLQTSTALETPDGQQHKLVIVSVVLMSISGANIFTGTSTWVHTCESKSEAHISPTIQTYACTHAQTNAQEKCGIHARTHNHSHTNIIVSSPLHTHTYTHNCTHVQEKGTQIKNAR